MPLSEGTKLIGENSTYQIEKMLGQGGFGIVYEASDSNGNKVAIKEYFPNMLATRVQGTEDVVPNTNAPEATKFFYSQKERFMQEAEHMKNLKENPNVVDVLECFEAKGTSYIVMEFITGNTLAYVMNHWSPDHKMPLKNVLNDLKPIAEVLERLHSVNLIHRDVSPNNIMFSKKTAKLLDFGAARIVLPGGKFTLTAIVNRNYSPPEQFLEIDAEKLQGTWSDVYALAATIYHAITGKLAPHANQRQFTVISTGKDIIKPPSAFGVEISPQQENALLKGLALKTQERYQTVREFFDALEGKVQQTKCPHCHKFYDANLNKCPGPDCPGNQKPQIECPHCHNFYDANLNKCPRPDCPGNQKIAKRSWMAAGCAILIALASFVYTNSIQTQRDNITNKAMELKTQVNKYDYINKDFGYGSSAYYADTPVLVLDKSDTNDGASGNIPVYWSSWDSQTTEQDAEISYPKGLHIEWSEKVTNQRRNAIVTSDADAGAYIVHFSNKKNNDAFDVLVVVK